MNKKDHIFFRKGKKDIDPVFEAIARACEGLVYISETDAPVEAFCIDRGQSETVSVLKQLDGSPAAAPVKEIDAVAFFTRLITVKDWFGDSEKSRAKKFLELKELLEESLHGLRAFRLGEVRVRYYVAGVTADGRLAGVKTSAVET